MSADVLVVGAGITGAFAALSAAEAGASVTLVDATGPAAMGSGWTLAGVRQSGRDPAELPLARAAVAQWPELADRLGAPTHYRQGGNLRLARNNAEVDAIQRLVADQRAAGLDLAFLGDRAAIEAVAPALSEAVLGASFCPSDGHADPIATVRAAIDAGERQGVRFRPGVRVERLVASGGRIVSAEIRTANGPETLCCGAVILATGVHVNALLGPFDLAVPLTMPVVTVVRTAPLPPLIEPVLGTAGADLALRQEVDGALRFTGGAQADAGVLDESGARPVVRPRTGRVGDVIARAELIVPAVAEAPVEAVWGGVLDLTPDALPVIDTAPGIDNLVVAAGFSGHGFGIGPVTGPLAADLALKRAPAHSLAAFAFTRFEERPTHAAAATLHG